jgi:RND superfamily putative drug exporter
VLRLISFATDVSAYSLNLTTALGLALAIDYTLLIISRYRDELADGADRDQALIRTMATAGRSVFFAAATVSLSMSVMVLFPMYFLKSFAYAGIATVGFVAFAAIVVTPAAIVLLGPRLDSLDVRQLMRRALRRPGPVRKPVEQLFWYRSTKFVMRRAVPVGLVVVTLLLLLGVPFLGVKWGCPTTACCRGRPQRMQSATSCAATSPMTRRRLCLLSSRTSAGCVRATSVATPPICRGYPTCPR